MSDTLSRTIVFPSPSSGSELSGILEAGIVVPEKKYFSFSDCNNIIKPKAITVQEFEKNNEFSEDFISWHVYLFMHGPDRRHKIYHEILNPSELWQFYSSLVEATKLMHKISKMKFSCRYRRKIDGISRFGLYVNSENGVTTFEFYMFRTGKLPYLAIFNYRQTYGVTKTVHSLLEGGHKMSQELNLISI